MTELFHLRVWGDLACFTRPEMKVERVSYTAMTPSAARGILEAILYKPQFRWNIHRIAIRRPVQFLSFRRNEVKAKASSRNPEPIVIEEQRTQRNTLALRDVDYVIEASMTLTRLANLPRQKPLGPDEEHGADNLQKYAAMFKRRVKNGQCFMQPCFGCREFPANFEAATPADMNVLPFINRDNSLGLMLYDVFDLDITPDYKSGKVNSQPKITFFPARLQNGILVEEAQSTLPTWDKVKTQLYA